MTARVLVVDDNGVTRQLVRRALGAHFEVLEAHGAESGVAAARDLGPDLILQDMVLPDVDGFDLLRRLRAVVGPALPILAFTGLVSRDVKTRMASAAFDDVVSKPFDPARLLDVVRNYLPSTGARTSALGAHRTLVLADDDALQRRLSASWLARMGFEVFLASNGEEALALARSKRPDAIVSDVLMPVMDGFELCSRIRADDELSWTPVVLLTNSYLDERDYDLAMRVGADGCVARTPELSELTAVLQRALSSETRPTLPPQCDGSRIQSDRMERALRQLDRQIALNTELTQRNAMLSAELAILGGLTTALADHGDPESALDVALSACLDAGGISWGVLLIQNGDEWTQRAIGLAPEALRAANADLIELARDTVRSDASRAPHDVTIQALARTETGDGTVLVLPVRHRDTVLGALLLGGAASTDEPGVAFAGVVAGQIAQTLALSRTFKAYEHATHEEQRRSRLFKSIVDSIEDAIVVVDPSFAPTEWNRAGEALATIGSERWLTDQQVYDPDRRTRIEWDDLPVVRAMRGERVARRELFSVLGNGLPTFWMSVNAQPVRGDDGRVEAAVMVIRDVTVEKNAQAQQMFSDRMTSIGMLAAGIAHEINNPLATVTAELEMAIEDTVGHDAHQGLVLAREAADRVKLIVKDLKTLSRGETDEISAIDVVTTLESALRMAGARTRSRASIRREMAVVPRVMGNEARLGQVFLNLLVNAADALPERNPGTSQITIRARASGDAHVVVEVTDNGSGMARDVKARLFTPFFTTKPVGVGSGLGLSVSQQIVSSMGGTIEVESELGVGTTFRLTFPVAPAGASIDAERASRSGLRILLVTSDVLMMQTIKRGLQRDHEVETAEEAGHALAKLGGPTPFDAILWEHDLPGLGAVALRARLAERDAALARRVIAIAPRATASDPVPPPVVVRPLDPDALRDALGSLWTGAQA